MRTMQREPRPAWKVAKNVRLTYKVPSKRTLAWAKKLLERRAEFPPRMVAELEKFAAGEPYVTTIEVIRERRK